MRKIQLVVLPIARRLRALKGGQEAGIGSCTLGTGNVSCCWTRSIDNVLSLLSPLVLALACTVLALPCSSPKVQTSTTSSQARRKNAKPVL